MSIVGGEREDPFVGLVEPVDAGEHLEPPISGLPQPEGQSSWERRTPVIPFNMRALAGVEDPAAALERIYPLGYASKRHLQPTRDAVDPFLNAQRQSGFDEWHAFGKECAREEARLRGVSTGNLVTTGKLRGHGDPVDLRCRRCGSVASGVLDEAGACFGGCSK